MGIDIKKSRIKNYVCSMGHGGNWGGISKKRIKTLKKVHNGKKPREKHSKCRQSGIKVFP